MILYCLTNFLYEFDNGKSTLNNSSHKFAADEQALCLTWKQASWDFFCGLIFWGDLENVYSLINCLLSYGEISVDEVSMVIQIV